MFGWEAIDIILPVSDTEETVALSNTNCERSDRGVKGMWWFWG